MSGEWASTEDVNRLVSAATAPSAPPPAPSPPPLRPDPRTPPARRPSQRWVKAKVAIPDTLRFSGPKTYIPPEGVARTIALLADGGSPHAQLLGTLAGPASAVAGLLRRGVDQVGVLGEVKDFSYLARYVERERGQGQ